MNSVRCAKCKNRVIEKSASGVRFRLQGALTIGADGICRGSCYWCKAALELPVELSKSFSAQEVRLVIFERGRVISEDS